MKIIKFKCEGKSYQLKPLSNGDYAIFGERGYYNPCNIGFNAAGIGFVTNRFNAGTLREDVVAMANAAFKAYRRNKTNK